MQHPPYFPIDYQVDGAWSGLLAISAVLAWKSAIKWRVFFVVLLLALVPLRFFPALFHTVRLRPVLLEFLITTYLVVSCVAAMWRTLRGWRKDEENA